MHYLQMLAFGPGRRRAALASVAAIGPGCRQPARPGPTARPWLATTLLRFRRPLPEP